MSMTRRQHLKMLGAGGLSVLLLPSLSCVHRPHIFDANGFEVVKPEFRDVLGIDFGPIDRSLPDIARADFSGDQPDRAHEILWNKPAFLASHPIPAPRERVPLVVIGAGMSGIISSYLLRDQKPVILERAERFGGNSRGESWREIDYGIGAAYFMEPRKDGPLDRLLDEVNAKSILRKKVDEDPVAIGGHRYTEFWKDPKRPKKIRQMTAYFEDVLHERNGQVYPDIPWTTEESKAHVLELDKITFREHLIKKFGSIPRDAEVVLEHYFWSTLGASMTQLSAAVCLNAFTAEFGVAYVAPGGNGAVAELFLNELAKVNPRENFRPNCLVFDVQVVGDGVVVAYVDKKGAVHSIHARAVVMACPKFIAKKVLREIEPARDEAISQMKYNAYLVGNIMLKSGVRDDFYDLFLATRGRLTSPDLATASRRDGITDVVLATYSQPRMDRSVLTLYRPLPYAEARGEILSPGSFPRVRAEFKSQIQREILPLFGKTEKDIHDLRVTRWGHAMPFARAGMLSRGVTEAIRKPIGDRVFFVEQDNWLYPALETCALEALHWAPEVRRVLRS